MLAHQTGWDSFLFILVPTAVMAVALVAARRGHVRSVEPTDRPAGDPVHTEV